MYYLIPMETPTVKKTSKKDYRKLILEGFVNHVLEHGTQPTSVFKFAKELKMKEEEFYTYFTSFEAIKSAIWESIFETTLESIEAQEVFKEYSAREKFLSFLFTWIEELKKNRSYLLSLYSDKTQSFKTHTHFTKEFKENFYHVII